MNGYEKLSYNDSIILGSQCVQRAESQGHSKFTSKSLDVAD